MNRHFVITVLTVVLACSSVGCVHSGQRLLEARIERDGQILLSTHFGVPDNWDRRAAWRQLKSQVFEVVDPAALDATNGDAATLKGASRITLNHAGVLWAAAEVDELRLTKRGTGADAWMLAPGEVERTARALDGGR